MNFKITAMALAAMATLPLLAEETKFDPVRPVCGLSQEAFTVQWSTQEPCPTKIQVREGGEPCMTWQNKGEEYKPWEKEFQICSKAETGICHRITVKGLKPGTRYYYRLFDEKGTPTATDQRWGAEKPWTREYSISTLAPEGYKTIIRIPVKVLIMPNVYNMYSAKSEKGEWAPLPPPVTEQEKNRIQQEFEIAKRFWFVNNGFRVWHDLQYYWDERPMYWGVMPEDAPAEYKALVPCRSFGNQEYLSPGGGTFTIVNLDGLEANNLSPVHDGFVGQIENALERKYDWRSKSWNWCTSGGGTLGVDAWCDGIPGRSQFLGDDIAWLTAHEYHHQIESQTYMSGLDAENDRVKYDHFSDRFRYQKTNGEWEEQTWGTGGKFGEHWSGIAMTDRELTDIQWLRHYFGQTIMVLDQDNDGVPDEGPLPFTEEKYGYDSCTAKTDGLMPDFDKIRTSIWSGGAMSPWYSREIKNVPRPNPKSIDSDGDSIADIADPLPLIPCQPLIWAMTAEIDGSPAEWETIPYIGRKSVHETSWSFKQGHDDSFYYGLLAVKGPFIEVNILLDGEADGIYNGYQGFARSQDLYEIRITPEKEGASLTYRSLGKGFNWKSTKIDDVTYVEFSIENRGESTWFWNGAGREIGNVVTLRMPAKDQYTLGDGYQPVYCFMEPITGQKKCPVPQPEELTAKEASLVLDFSKNPDLSGLEFTSNDWEIKDGSLNLKQGLDPNASCYLLVPGFTGSGDFTIMMEFEAKADAVLGAFSKDTKEINPGQDSIGFLGGYGNELGKIRLISQGEVTDERVRLTPGRHTMQFEKKGNYFFLQYDGKVVGWYREASQRPAHRLGLVGVPDSDLKVHRLLVKGEK